MKYILILVFLLSCSKNNRDEGKILQQVSQPLTHFDPQMTTGLASLIQLAKMYESLLETHPFDGPYKVLPNLAASLPQISKDQLTYTFKLREDVTYTECPCFKEKERRLKAEDFVTTFKRIADPHLSSPHYGYWKKQISGLEEWYKANQGHTATDYSLPLNGVVALDSHTLQITLKTPNLYFVNDLTTPTTAPIPLEVLKCYNNDLSKNVVGTGAFLLKKYVRKSKIEYVRNPDFRDKHFPKTASKEYESYVNEYGGRKIPFLDGIRVHISNETQTQWLNFLKGNLDYLEIPKDNFSEAMTPQNTLSSEMKARGIELGITPSNSNIYYFGFNNKDKLFKNKHLRRAIAYAFDQVTYNKLFFNGTADLAHSLLPPNIPGNTPPLKSPFIGTKIEEARRELKLAGYAGGKGLPEITLTVRNSTLARQIGDFFVKEMAKINIRAKVDMVAWGTLLEKAQKGDFQIFYLAWFVGLPTGFQFFDLLYGPNWPGSYNRMGHVNEKFDELYNNAMISTNPDLQARNFSIMNKIVLEDVPLLPLVHARDFFVKQSRLKNYVPAEATGGLEQYFDIVLSK